MSPLRPGETFRKKFLIESELGSGGMGTVYQALHLRMQTRVALKVLDSEHTKVWANVRRFEREALASARLRGPYTVRVYDVDTAESGAPFLVMELLRGSELSASLKLRDQPREVLIDWTIQICSAIHEAHELGIIHRDLKPSNVFVLERTNRIKIVDFGISKVHGGADITADSQSLGTPKYMSPEQLLGQAVSPQSDIWAIGIILYRMLTGKHPFRLPKHAPPFVLAASTLTQKPVPILDHAPDLPGELAEAVMKCLRKPPSERWPSARDLAKQLEPFGTGDVVFEQVPKPAHEEQLLPELPAQDTLSPIRGHDEQVANSSFPPTVELPRATSSALPLHRSPIAYRQTPAAINPENSDFVRRPTFRYHLYAIAAVVVVLTLAGLYAWASRSKSKDDAGIGATADPTTVSNVEPVAGGGAKTHAAIDAAGADASATASSTAAGAPARSASAKPLNKRFGTSPPSTTPPTTEPPPKKPPGASTENPLFL